MNHISVSGTWL